MAKSDAPLPMPVELVLDHPTMRVAGAITTSCVLQLACRYWLAGCKPLPAEAHDRMVLARTNSPAWLRHGAAIDEVLAVILPILSRAREARLADLEDRRARALRGHARQVAEGRAPHLSPHHASKRRKRGMASAVDVIAYDAMASMGVQLRRIGPGETVESVIAREAGNARDVAGSGLTGLGHASPPPDAATAISPPAHPAKPRSGMRETTKR